jgi:hypothetical protein
MAGLTVDQLSSSFDARLDNNAQNLLLFSGSFNTRLEEFQAESVLGKVNTLSGSHTTLSASFTSNSSSFNSRINTIKASELALSASVSSDVTSVTANIDSLNDFSASITSSFNSLSSSVNSSSASFASRINTLRAGGVTFDDFNALTQSLSGVISSSAQLNNATITNLTITNLTTINETASVVFSSGSNQFGDALNDTQILSGSVYIVGSGSLNGYTLLTSNNTSSFLTSLNGALSSSAQVLNGSGIFSSSAQLPSGLVSASSQVLVSSGIFSSSAQLPTGLVSASSQVLDGSGIFSSSAQLPTNLISGSSQITAFGFISSSTSIATGSFATTGSNQFTGSQNINGDVIITGSTLSVKKSTDSDPFFVVDADSKRLALVQGNGEIPGEFYLALSGSSAFFPRPTKTLLYGARGFKFQTNNGTVSEFSGSLLMSGSIIPAVGSGETTSSFSLGSATNAWKDLWVSNGTINFLGADGTPQGTLSSTATGLQLGSSTISGSMVVTGSLTIVNALGNGQKVLGVDGILGANYIAGNSGYLGVENGMTRSVQPIISSYFTNYYTTINSAPYKWEMADLGIGSTYSWNYGRFTPSPAIKVGHNTELSFYTGSSSNIYSPGFSTIISSNNNLSGLERTDAVAYSNGINHVLAVTGSLLSRDNTTLGTKATDLTYIRGAATISGSLVVTGSLTVSSSAAVDVKVIGKTDLTGSLFMTSSGLEYAKFETNRFSVFSSGGFWLELGSANNGLSIQDFGDATQGTWFTTEQPLKLMGPVTQLSALNGDPGIVNVIGKMNVTGSVVLVPQGAPTSPASGSLYFSSADSHFYGWNGLVWKQLDN